MRGKERPRGLTKSKKNTWNISKRMETKQPSNVLTIRSLHDKSSCCNSGNVVKLHLALRSKPKRDEVKIGTSKKGNFFLSLTLVDVGRRDIAPLVLVTN